MNPDELQDLQHRLHRIESMLAYSLGIQKAQQVAAPNKDEAKQLHVMGLGPWNRVTRETNHFEIWKEGYIRQAAALVAAENKGASDGQEA